MAGLRSYRKPSHVAVGVLSHLVAIVQASTFDARYSRQGGLCLASLLRSWSLPIKKIVYVLSKTDGRMVLVE